MYLDDALGAHDDEELCNTISSGFIPKAENFVDYY